jgi:hypothetical protein
VRLSNPDVDLTVCTSRMKNGGRSSGPAAFLEDPEVAAVAAEGSNAESLGHAEQIVAAGKHLLLDKPTGGRFRPLRASDRHGA